MSEDPQPAELLEVALEASAEAGAVLMDRVGSVGKVETKSSPTDPVTEADKRAETVLLHVIRSRRPKDSIISEESGVEDGGSALRWVVDPLDGTVNFLYGIPAWSVSVAVEDYRGCLAAVIRNPPRDETFTAVRGGGARLNGQAIRVSDVVDLSEALVGTGFSYVPEARLVQAERLPRVLPTVRDVRRLGSAALDLAYLACGRLDGFFEAPMERWDKAAGELLVREAGGILSELAAPLPDQSPGLIASNPGLHEALKQLVLG